MTAAEIRRRAFANKIKAVLDERPGLCPGCRQPLLKVKGKWTCPDVIDGRDKGISVPIKFEPTVGPTARASEIPTFGEGGTGTGGGGCEVVYITDEDACDPDLNGYIIGGPYPTEEEAQDACCPEAATVLCGGYEWPEYLCVTISPNGCPDLVTPVKVLAQNDPGTCGTSQLCWLLNASGPGWSVSGRIYAPCDPANWTTGSCPIPSVHFNGATTCDSTFSVVYACGLYTNQTTVTATATAVGTTITDVSIRLDLYTGAAFTLEATNDLSGC